MVVISKRKIGPTLIEKGLITKEQLKKAQERMKKSDQSLGKALTSLGFISEENLIKFIGEQLDIPHVILSQQLIDPNAVNTIPEKMARHYQLIPLFNVLETITVAMVDPLNFYALEDIKLRTGCEVNPVIAAESDVMKAIDTYYRPTYDLGEAIKGTSDVSLEVVEEKKVDLEEEKMKAEDAPIVKLVNNIVGKAISEGASDIHIEPYEDDLRIRYRIDGTLYEVASCPKQLHAAVISRIKILSQLDITETRLPQDGRFRVKFRGRDIDFRVSTLPTSFGDKAVIRILDKGSLSLNLGDLGFEPEMLRIFEESIANPYGMILVTGPTGSGKTTTLYSALNRINSPTKNIITVEDPVEFQLKGINQVQAHPKIGLTFAAALRSFLRQDPDVIMVGEIRDLETAEISIRAALTGHLVFSTLHTNDAVGTISRLIDMGVEPFLVISSVIMVIAQRLVRRICPQCKHEETPSPEFLKRMGIRKSERTLLYRGAGCKNCGNSGYQGRVALYEILSLSEPIKDLIIKRESPGALKEEARKMGMKTLRESGWEKVLQGMTTVEEVLSVTSAEAKEESEEQRDIVV